MDSRKQTPPVARQERSSRHPKALAVNPRIDALIGEVVLFPGESRNLFNKLHKQLWDDLRPGDMIQEVLVREIAELVMEIGRHKRFQKNLLEYFAEDGLRDLIQSRERPALDLEPDLDDMRLVIGWRFGDTTIIDELQRIIRTGQSLAEAVEARTLRLHFDQFEKLDYLRVRAEARLEKTIQLFDDRARSLAISRSRLVQSG